MERSASVVTISDIAKELGVSKSTVSRVINCKGRIGADAAAGDGCGAGLHRPHPGAAALPASAGRTQGSAAPARGNGAAAVPLAGASVAGKRDLRPNGCCPEQSQRPWRTVPGKTGADGRDISSKNYLFDELTKNNRKNFILCPLVSGAVRVYD